MDYLDIITTALGLLYIILEYRVSIWLWVVSILMPALDIMLYWNHGLYGDSALAIYYTLAAVYGLVVWKIAAIKSSRLRNLEASGSRVLEDSSSRNLETSNLQGSESSQAAVADIPSHMPLRLYFPAFAFFFVAWGATYWILANYTNSTVPVLDGFTNALSIVGMWALSRKFVEQWLFWIVVDVVCTYLYIIKGIPFKAGLYALYVVIAIAGYRKWNKLSKR